MKRLLRDRANFPILEEILSLLLNDQIQIVEILKDEDSPCSWDDAKKDRIDVMAKNHTGEFIGIRVQNMRYLYYLEYLHYGTPKDAFAIYGNQQVKKVYSISILYFDLGKGNDYLYHGQNHFIGVHTNDELLITAKEEGAIVQKLPSEIFPEYYLIRVNEFNQVAKTPLEEWMQYLKTGNIDPDTTAPGLSEAREKLLYHNMSPEERHAYDEHVNAIMIQNDVLNTAKQESHAEGRAEGLEEGRAEGLEEGRAEGRAETKYEIARQMKADGMTWEAIRKYTGLTEEEIEKA